MKTSFFAMAAGAVALALPVSALADSMGTPPGAVLAASEPGRAFPAIFGAASAVALPGGTAYGALTYADPRGGVSGEGGDGDLVLGYAFGNPIDAVSVSVGLNITSLKGFGDDGAVDISLSRLVHSSDSSATFVGLSAGNLLAWGDAANGDEKFAGYVSHVMAMPSAGGEIPMQFTLGYGDRTTRDDTTGVLEEGLFAGFGVGITQSLSASISATETQANIGLTLTVPQVPGLGISLGVYDVSDNTNRQQTALTVGFAF